ncbi:MAG: arginine--tRNA ligase [Candidatus Sigynarchaeota archaeon]
MSTSTTATASLDPMAIVHEAIKKALESALVAIGARAPEITFEIPPDPKFGDLACPVCMGLARALKKNPRQIAADVKAKLDQTKIDWIAKVEVAGAGYLNFYLDWTRFMALVHDYIAEKGDRFGFVDVGKGKKVVVEHTSANPNKPIHLGTARCAVIGDLASRLLKMAGYNVEVENYIDDLGRQIAVLLHGYNQHKDEVVRKPGDKADYYYGLVYVKGSEDIDDKPGGEEIVRDILHKMEDPSTPENQLAKEIVDQALKGQLETMWRMNIFYDVLIWERHIITSGLFARAIENMMKRSPKTCYKVESGEDKDCIVLDMSSFGEKYVQDKKPYKILVRSNGVATYTGKDIAFQLWKFGEAAGFFSYDVFVEQPNGQPLYSTVLDEDKEKGKGEKAKKKTLAMNLGHADRVINVIGYEQKFPQEVVKSAMKVLGFEDHYENSQHLSFKHVWLPGQKFSGRKGTWVGFHADAAIDKATEKALAIIKGQNPEMAPAEQETIASIIGVGAIKFYLAKFDMEKEITIVWEELLNFEGDACPYVQYSCVRAQSILNKAKEGGVTIPDAKSALHAQNLDMPEARTLYFTMAQLPGKVANWSASLEINQIPLYALELADKFNKFYHACPILRSDVPAPVQEARLLLVQDTIVVLRQVLRQLMGIDIPQKM